ncbi:MAG: type II CRISPR-associated endonuclease Cas1 [Caulobacterales bacterium]|nr:type II CRISPR-associated endonuclease Cas1 [Caulobacterales bacterium]
MAWRGLHLTQPSRLSVADDQIVIGQEDGEVRLAIEDLAWVVVDCPRTSLTASLMSALVDKGVAVIFTDATHTPSGVTLPFHRHHRQADVLAKQLAASVPLKKRLWQAVVRRKIDNQAAALEAVGAGGATTLRAMSARVGSGDPGNVEAQAARYYWGKLWPAFRRDDDGDRRNMMLNYGYAVIRSGVARALVASGLIPALGLKHAGVSNAFNLADDLVEPFRPFVDVLAWRTVGKGAPSRDDLSVEDRRAMAAVLLGEAGLQETTVTLLVATERSAESLVRALESATPAVLGLPVLRS